MVMSAQRENLEVLIAWLDAMRRGDLAAVAELFAPDVVWRGVPADAICHNRDEVMDMLAADLPPGPRTPQALELVAGEGAVVLGIRSPVLVEVGEEPLPGQMLNVFTVHDGRITAVRDYAERADALRAAGAAEPGWV
jgi:ketosteroid isomerase-like protein